MPRGIARANEQHENDQRNQKGAHGARFPSAAEDCRDRERGEQSQAEARSQGSAISASMLGRPSNASTSATHLDFGDPLPRPPSGWSVRACGPVQPRTLQRTN